MRMSCNGCRVLRKGCDEDCVLRPCLSWIISPESQANATLFLAKFYGRAGLLNLINAGPHHLRPDIFRSLLHEACGRIINPIYGSVGLIWSGNWEQCQAAVESVLQGSPIMQLPSNHHPDATPSNPVMPLESCDIRHVSKDPSRRNHHLPRKWFKRADGGSQSAVSTINGVEELAKFGISWWKPEELEVNRAFSQDLFSVKTEEARLLNHVDGVGMSESHHRCANDDESGKVLLDLTLG